MTDLREKIAKILASKFIAPNGQLLDASDAIISALPDMVPDLVWCEPFTDDETKMIYHSSRGAIKTYTVYDWSSLPEWKSDYYECFGAHPTLEAAKAAANAHHRAQVMAELGVK